MASGNGGDHVSCIQQLYQSISHGGVACGKQFSVAEGRRRGAGDVEITENICPFEKEGALYNFGQLTLFGCLFGAVH